jgi:hypothetical protein
MKPLRGSAAMSRHSACTSGTDGSAPSADPMALTTSMLVTSAHIPDRSGAGQSRESFRSGSWGSHGLSSKEHCPRRWLGAIESWILWISFVRIRSGTVAYSDYCRFIAFGDSA